MYEAREGHCERWSDSATHQTQFTFVQQQPVKAAQQLCNMLVCAGLAPRPPVGVPPGLPTPGRNLASSMSDPLAGSGSGAAEYTRVTPEAALAKQLLGVDLDEAERAVMLDDTAGQGHELF
jgi:hypothetical protein